MKVRVYMYDFELDIDDSKLEGLDEDKQREFIEEYIYSFIEDGHNHLDYSYQTL